MRYFGEHWRAAILNDCQPCPVPVGEPCILCDNTIKEGDQGLLMPLPMHRGCLLAQVLGDTLGYGDLDTYDAGLEIIRQQDLRKESRGKS